MNTSGTGDIITATEGEVPFDSDSIGAYTEGTKKDTLVIPNPPGTPLPQTGGPGVGFFAALGAVLTLGSGAILMLKTVRRRKQQA